MNICNGVSERRQMTRAQKIVDLMLRTDAFSQWLGIVALDVSEGFACVKMTVRPEMLNGHGVAHGGIVFSLSDSALAFAANARGQKAVSIETSASYIKPVLAGDELVAAAKEESMYGRLGYYVIRVEKEKELVSLLKGVAYWKDETWDI